MLQFPGVRDCQPYFQIVTAAFRNVDPMCPKLIRRTWDAIDNVTSTGMLQVLRIRYVKIAYFLKSGLYLTFKQFDLTLRTAISSVMYNIVYDVVYIF